jgi:hypothetical protein
MLGAGGECSYVEMYLEDCSDKQRTYFLLEHTLFPLILDCFTNMLVIKCESNNSLQEIQEDSSV